MMTKQPRAEATTNPRPSAAVMMAAVGLSFSMAVFQVWD